MTSPTDLATAIPALPDPNAMHTGIVESVGPLVVAWKGGQIREPGCLGWYAPTVGDNVGLMRQGQTWLCFGVIRPATSALPAAAPLGANLFTAGTVALVTAETAVTSAAWDQEPTFVFPADRIFRVTVTGGCYENAGSFHMVDIRVRLGAQTTSGTLLGLFRHQLVGAAGVVTSASYLAYFQNATAAPVVSPLSLTVARLSGAGSVSLYGDANLPLIVAVEDLGSASDNPTLAAGCPSV